MRILHALARFTALSLVIALSSFGSAPVSAAATKAPVKIGLIYSKTGLLATYIQEYSDGFKVGLDYVTHGTGVCDGHPLEITELDDAGTPATAITEAKGLIGQGFKIIAGTGSSGIAVQMAPLAKENQVLYISGAAAYDGISGQNRYTFRAGRQTYQDVATAAQIVGDVSGKNVLVLAQDSTFGKANYLAVYTAFGGAHVTPLLIPLTANDFTPFAQKAIDAHADMVYVAWAGTTAGALWKSLDDAGLFEKTQVITGLAESASYPIFGPVASKISLISHYFYQGPHNRANDYLIAALKKQGKIPEIFGPDGFVTAQMICHAVTAADGDQNVDAMINSLEGWTFNAPKGGQTIRVADHAMLQPMFIARLTSTPSGYQPQLVKTLEPLAVAPPVRISKNW